ncbi:MAG: STAS-like domain-containing protein [Lentisphaeria bacterium]|jgi:uncharacterized protein YejL (UPF0352 family)
MSDRTQLKIYDIVGSPVWVSTADGQKVYEKIVTAFKAKRKVDLSFLNRGNLITAFLNAAIGQLYNGDYTEAFLTANLAYTEITDEDRQMVDRAIENAKRYFANKPQHDAAWKEVIGDEEK